jgi:group I intron endonuclease
MACIYQIKNLVNNKIYIGSTQRQNPFKRKAEHFCKLKGNYHNNKHLQSSWNKYGEDNFEFTIIEELNFPVEYIYIMEKELFYINKYNPQYNIAKETKGGKLGRVVSKEQKKYLSKLFTGREVSENTKVKIKLARAKQIITEEHKENISKSLKGRKVTWEIKPKSDNEKQNAKQKLLKDFENKTGIFDINNLIKRSNSLKVKFNTLEMKEKLKLVARKRNLKCFIGYKNNVIVGEFFNQVEAAKILNLKASEIGAVLRKKQKTTKEYSFVYKNI